jgi:hypothetical protein
MSVIINPIITNAGLNVFTPMATGIEFTFTHVAVGTGTSAVNANATALENEIDRFTIAGGGVIAGGKAVSINALVTNHSNANPQDYNISEIGFYGLDANNNTILFAIHRQNTTIVRKVAGADIALPFVLGLSALPVENMTVTIDTNTSGALALLGQHVANAHPHTQYKRTLDNTEQLKIANGTDNDHAVSKGQLDGAISTEATTRANADTALQNSKADLGGSNTQRFKVADAIDNDEAVSKSQLNSAVSGIPPADLSGKADLAGSSTQTFSVATATAAAHAVRKDQFDAKTGIATDTTAGIVEKATQAEMNAGTANVWPDAATIFNGFVQSGTTNGYIKLPQWMGGLIIQWGYNSDTVTVEKLITFPTAFSSACYTIQCTGDETNNAGAEIINVKSVTTSSFTWVGAVGSGTGVSPEAQKGYWIAIGK